MPEFMHEYLDRARDGLDAALEIWEKGGWGMWALAGIALCLYGLGIHIYLRLRALGFLRVRESRWRRWLDHPEERRGRIGELLDDVTGAATLKEVNDRFGHLLVTESAPFERDLKVMKICVSTAPLVGLLGTVTGMLATFDALSGESGGDQTMEMIAGGISEALITTETGLVIALPGLFFNVNLARSFERYKAFLAHLQTVCTQDRYRKLRDQKHERIEIVKQIRERLHRAAAC